MQAKTNVDGAAIGTSEKDKYRLMLLVLARVDVDSSPGIAISCKACFAGFSEALENISELSEEICQRSNTRRANVQLMLGNAVELLQKAASCKGIAWDIYRAIRKAVIVRKWINTWSCQDTVLEASKYNVTRRNVFRATKHHMEEPELQATAGVFSTSGSRGKRLRSTEMFKRKVIDLVRSLILEDDRLKEYMEIFDQEISRGLDKDTCEEATVKSIVTHVNKLPTGQEEGQFLGLDFSGPTIKVMLVKLENRECTVTQKMYDIPEKYHTGKSEKLFDFVAKSIANFLSGLKLKVSRIPLGVTFGFPIEQTSLQDCKLLRWSKGFQCDDLIDKNVFLRLKNSIRKFPELKKVFVIGILNDAVSAVLARAWQDPTCLIGAVIGPGASCCYAEKVHRVTKYEAENYGIKDIYMNLESAQLGEDGCLEDYWTLYDQEIDEMSPNPGKIINHKLISTDYFCDLVQLIMTKCINANIIFNGEIPSTFSKKNSIKLDHLRRIESDPDNDHQNCRQVLNELGFEDATDEDCFQVQFICRCVSRRSANLVAAQLAAIINRINASTVTIAADGDLIKNYPNYKWYLTRKIKQLKKEDCQFQIQEAEENGLGPAVMAAVFGEEVMNRDEKLRRLPGFPMEKCHFGKKGKCTNPECDSSHPCDTSLVNPLTKPMTTTSQDLSPNGCLDKDTTEDKSEVPAETKCRQKNQKKEECKPCRGYDRL